MKWERGDFRKGMTLVEVLVSIAVCAVLAVLALSAIKKARERSRRSSCINNLRQTGLGASQWAIDNKSEFPMVLSTNLGGTREYIESGELFRYFQVMSNDLNTPVILVCPSDVRQPAKDFNTLRNSNISYFIALDATEQTPSLILSGDRNLTNDTLLPNGILEITSKSVVGWTDKMHKGQGNVALADGSVMALSSSHVRAMLANTGMATNRLAMPW
jgi:prepilin-type N-terminal cleavage/methylation domain-containing protein/prepilin-type processing-associated H-X9-DG protein